MSKGSRPRPYSVAQQEYDNRWDAIFGRDLENTQPTPEPHLLCALSVETSVVQEQLIITSSVPIQMSQANQEVDTNETTLGRTIPPQHN